MRAVAAASRTLTFCLTAGICITGLRAQPTVWFAPLDPAVRTFDLGSPRSGSIDFMDLFSPSAPWPMAASRTHVFKLYASLFFPSLLPDSLSDSQLRTVIAELDRRNIALAIEWGPLTAQGCGDGIEGFTGLSASYIANKIHSLGGNLRFIAMDEPFQHASLYGGPGACHWTPQQVAANALAQIAQVRAVFPGVVVGDIEVVPDIFNVPDWVDRYTAWLDAWRTASGAPLGFFHVDVDWRNPTWQAGVESLRAALAQRGIPFGMIYNGTGLESSDEEWVGRAEGNFVDYEILRGGIRPDHVVFQSWNHYPKHLLPESDTATFTHLINRYFRDRTRLSLDATSIFAQGALANSHGAPLPSTPVTVTAEPVSGQGVATTYTMTGTVPAAINKATIQLCIQLCGGAGPANVSLYSYEYVDSHGRVTLDFSNGLNGWGVKGDGTASVGIGSGGGGPFLLVTGAPQQSTFVNSPEFTVSPGSTYVLKIRARIAPDATGSGLFALIFLAGQEVSRHTLLFSPGSLELGRAPTGPDGSFALQFASLPTGMFHMKAYYPGSETSWPAIATASITQSLNATPPAPSSGVGLNQPFTFTFTDDNGFADLNVLNVLINDAVDGRNACYVAYVRSTNTLYLVNDAGAAGGPFAGSLSLPTSAAIGNSQCTIRGTGSSAVTAGNTITLVLNIGFSSGFGGRRLFYLAARGALGGNSGWLPLGIWTVPGSITNPTIASSTPARAESSTVDLSTTFTNTAGFADFTVINLLINSAVDGRNGCYLAYVRSGNYVVLVNDAGDAGGPYVGSQPIPGSIPIANSQCSLDTAASTVFASGNTLTLNLRLSFAGSFRGNRIVYAAARGGAGNSGWSPVGTITVP
ncbi:MAG: hypothetical protein R2729_31825 [Bryobacteraceae bacterium]